MQTDDSFMKKRRLFIGFLLLFALSTTACEFNFDLGGSVSSKSKSSSFDSSDINNSDSDSSSSGSSSQGGDKATASFDIYPFNDVHGNVKDTQNKGLGIAKTTTLLKELSQGRETVFISQGDMWQGSVESNYTRGKLVTEWMNNMDFVSMTLGNHEFDWGQDNIREVAEFADFPFLGINVLYSGTKQRVDYAQASTTFMRDGAKIGVIGAIGNCLSSISSSQVQGVYFATGNELGQLVANESTRLRNEEHCDFIIYSIHGSGSRDADDSYPIALSSSHYVDLVFEGHTHDDYAEVDDAGVYHIQCYGDNVNSYKVTVDLDLEEHTFVVEEPMKLNFSNATSPYKNYTEDEETNALFTKYYDQYAFAYEELGYNSSWKSANVLRQLCSYLYLQAGLEKWGANYNIILGGGYTSCRGSGLAAGMVIYAQIDELFPFDNDVVLCSVKGSDLKGTRFITESNYNNNNYFMSWSDYGYEARNNIQDNETYYLVTDTYNSDYSYNHLTVLDRLEAGGTYARDLIAEYIREGNYDERPKDHHAGTVDDPKSIAEALEYAEAHPGATADAAGAEGFFYIGIVVTKASKLGDSGDMNNVYVRDTENYSSVMQIYYMSKYQGATSVDNWTGVDDLQIGDTIVFYGKAFKYNSNINEFSSGAYCYSINGVLTGPSA